MATVEASNISNVPNVFDYGLDCDDNLSIKIANFRGQQIILKDNEIVNPFFVDLVESQLSSLNEKELYSIYKRVLVICVKQSYDKERDKEAQAIFKNVLTKQDLVNISKYFTLIPCPRKILNNKNQYARAVRVKKNLLEYFNNSHTLNIVLENDEIVLPMFELTEDMAQLHVSMYQNTQTVAYIPKLLTLNNYYNTHQKLSQLIMSIKETDYWTNPYNCAFSMTDQFQQRSFQFKDINNDRIKSSVALKSTDNDNVKSVIASFQQNSSKSGGDKSYQLTHVYKPDDFTDLSKVLTTSSDRTYFATVDKGQLLITKEQVTELFSTLKTDKDKFDLFNALLVSKEYCHMVLNNYEILTLMQPLIKKFLPLYKYLFGYAWSTFYIEECLFKTRTTKNSRYVFDIRTANKLPVFPFAQDSIHQNPYVALLVSDAVCDIQNNHMALAPGEDISGTQIDTLENFVWKFNLFTTGDASKNIFDGLDWSDAEGNDKYAFSGSMIPAFLSTKPALFDLVVNKSDNEAKQWLTYFGQYYKDSDIDFMCNDDSVFKFMDSIMTVKTIVEKNLKTKVEVEPIKTTTIVITGHFLKEKLDEIREYVGNYNLDVAEVIKRIDTNQIKEYFYGIYTDTKRKNNRTQRAALKEETKHNTMYEDYFKLVSIDDIKLVIVEYEIGKETQVEKDCETYTYLNDVRDKSMHVSNDKNIMIFKISENIKFKIHSDKLLHSIEAFRAKSHDFFAIVGRFHLPCVRGYYNGKTVYLEPSCITANMTGINLDYKYFAGVRDPIEILNKYAMRGFSTPLNTSEKQHMAFYNTGTQPNAKIFDVNPLDKVKDMKKLFGYKDINHNLFKPSHFIHGFPLDTFNKPTRQTVKNISDLQKLYATKYGYDVATTGLNMFKFTAVGEDGKIVPLQKWVIEACWNMLN